MTIAAHFLPSRGLLRTAIRPVARTMRALPAWLALTGRPRRAPLALFLSAAVRGDGAARLRIYDIAGDLRRHGWAAAVLPPGLTLTQRRRMIAFAAPDVLVMQGACLALNCPALYPGQRIVFDMDDADFHLAHLAGPVREAMAGIATVIAGSAYVVRPEQRSSFCFQ